MADTFSPRSVTGLDRLIGERIREARIDARLTLDELSDIVGISHQQLQKYETAANRICASRLWHVANALERPLLWFYGDEQPAQKLPSDVRAALRHAQATIEKALK